MNDMLAPAAPALGEDFDVKSLYSFVANTIKTLNIERKSRPGAPRTAEINAELAVLKPAYSALKLLVNSPFHDKKVPRGGGGPAVDATVLRKVLQLKAELQRQQQQRQKTVVRDR